MADTLLSARNISLNFNHKKVLDKVNIDVAKGEIVTVIGPNGSGKTSLLRVLLGLQKPDEGQVTLANNLVIGYMPQKLTVEKVMPLTVRRFLRLRGNSRRLRDIETVEQMADTLSISHIMKHQMHDISGGELQRVMLARALLLEPNLLVMDEPTQGLDVTGQIELYKLIAEIRKSEHCGILMVSHDLHMVMAATDRVICLNHHICCEGHPEDVSKNEQYLSLFNKDETKELAFYSHNHDHTHDVSGEVDH